MRNTPIPFKMENVEATIPERFDHVMRTVPNNLAVYSKNLKYTYRALNARASQIAGALLASGGKKGDTAAILLAYGPDIVAAILGVLKAGMVFVVLDPSLPSFRLRAIAEDSLAGYILSDKENLTLAGELGQDKVPVIDLETLNTVPGKENPALQLLPSDPAGIYYTTGTTGRPKGILRNHRDLLFRGWTYNDLYKVGKADRVSHVFLFSFAASTSDMFGTILNGATLCLYDIRKSTLQQTVNWLVREKITIFHPPVAFFRKMLDDLVGKVKFPDLRMVLFGGASLYKRDIERSREIFRSDCILSNRFSSTEVGLTSNYLIDKNTRFEGDIVPIGYPIKGVDVFLLDDTGRAVKPGEVGEIAVSSRFLSLGYWQDAGNTEKQYRSLEPDGVDRLFLTNDLGCLNEDGLLVHLGRKDSVVKVRGFRVDITEVEAALASHPSILQLAVTAHPLPGSEEKRLIAYIVSNQESYPQKRELRGFLEHKVPSYMIPSHFIPLETLPLNANGKIDLSALPEPPESINEQFVSPRDEVETRIARIWSQTLQIEKIGIHDDFFELGGDSLTAIELAGKLKKGLGFKAPLTKLFDVPTVASQADILRGEKNS